ncbi:MAG TPA: hypothetical protein PKZ84_07600 [Anaerolineae bacterium]|nr:hypothetical protein [Anaerolineae bacterium]HQI84133.1 hypothetical protein [Anaerolineae bacterium]
MTSKVRKGHPAHVLLISLNTRCSIGFHNIHGLGLLTPNLPGILEITNEFLFPGVYAQARLTPRGMSSPFRLDRCKLLIPFSFLFPLYFLPIAA